MTRVTRALVLAGTLFLAAGVASAAPETRPAAPPPPDGSGPARSAEVADKRRVVGVLEVRVDGVPDEVKETFQRGLESQVDARHYHLWNRARMRQLLMRSTKWTEGCVVGKCLAEVKSQTGADLVLLATLTGSGTSFGYVVTLVRTDTGAVLQQESDRCDVCTVNEAMEKATHATTTLLGRVPEALPDVVAEQSAGVEEAIAQGNEKLLAQRHRTIRLGVGIALVGVGILVTGGALYAVDSKNYAAMTATAGAAMAISGLVVFTF